MGSVTDRVEQIIAPSLRDMGYELVQLRLLGKDGGRKTLQIMVECADGGGITLDDCTQISKTVSVLLDVEDPISGSYDLEVSSPGIDRPLVKPRDFVRFKGYMAKISLTQPLQGQRRFTGKLGELKDDRLELLQEDGKKAVVDIATIERAKLVITDELLKECRCKVMADS